MIEFQTVNPSFVFAGLSWLVYTGLGKGRRKGRRSGFSRSFADMKSNPKSCRKDTGFGAKHSY